MTMIINKLTQNKQALREQLKDTRSLIPEATAEEFSDRICQNVLSLPEVDTANIVFIFLSYGHEVATNALIETFLAENKTLAVPKILSKNRMIAAKFSSWDDVAPAELGILAPVSSEPLIAEFDICITPGLGFTEQGKRIGYGAGYYDRWFAENPVKHKIALAFESQLLDDIPTDEYDQTVDTIVTEQRVIRIGEFSKISS